MIRCRKNRYAPMRGPYLNPPLLPRGVQGGAPRPLRLGGQTCVQAQRHLPAAWGGVGRRNVTTSLSLPKPPLPPMGEIHPLRRAPEGGLLSLPLLGREGHQLAMRPCACYRPQTRNPGAGGARGMEGGDTSLLGHGPDTALGGPNPPQCGVPLGGGEDRLWLLPGVRVGLGRRVRRWEWRLGGGGGERTCQWGLCWSRPECVWGGASGWKGGGGEATPAGRHWAVPGGAGAGGVVAGPQTYSRFPTAFG